MSVDLRYQNSGSFGADAICIFKIKIYSTQVNAITSHLIHKNIIAIAICDNGGFLQESMGMSPYDQLGIFSCSANPRSSGLCSSA